MQAQMETWERLRDLNEYVQTSLSAFNQLPQGNKVASNLLKNVLMENEQSREDFQKGIHFLYSITHTMWIILARSNVLETTDLLQEIRSALEEEMKRKQNKG